jgi:hypothetical protein
VISEKTMSKENIDLGRRALFSGNLATAAAVTAGVVLASALPAAAAPREDEHALPDGRRDADVLNFALNLEYLEAEYYVRGVLGQSLDQAAGGGAMGETVRGGRRVSFSGSRRREFLEDVARNEVAHVQFIRAVLGGEAVTRPALDFDAGFAAVAQATGMSGFDPFASEENFFLGAYLFEDVGVTAYKGAAKLLHNDRVLESAAGILATEAYHAGCVRTVLYKMGGHARDGAGRISRMRDSLDGAYPSDAPLVVDGKANIVPSDSSGIAASRTPQQVLNIVYANGSAGTTQGGFYPQGFSGNIRST